MTAVKFRNLYHVDEVRFRHGNVFRYVDHVAKGSSPLQRGHLAYRCVLWVLAYRCVLWVLAYRCVLWVLAYRCVLWVLAYRYLRVQANRILFFIIFFYISIRALLQLLLLLLFIVNFWFAIASAKFFCRAYGFV